MPSKYHLLAAIALAAVSSGAVARDGAVYVGIEGGVIKPDNLKLDYEQGALSVNNGFVLEHGTGFDADVIVGYDFGLLRAEGELGWKRAGIEDVAVAPTVFTTTARPAVDGRTRAISAMANLLLDFGSNDGLQVYGGGGIGAAKIDVDSTITGPGAPVGAGINGSDRSLAWQLLAGIRLPVSYNADLGLKYRYFNSKLKLTDSNGASLDERVDGRFRSHSLLASLIFNLGARPVPPVVVEPAPPPPPPPPPPPATQTCPDGSVILATDACPVPPPPPPPPPPAPVRG